ncbi:MAG: FadR/GntR family transcriptional regulator, partial [Solirubrobacteraceae bacterium]
MTDSGLERLRPARGRREAGKPVRPNSLTSQVESLIEEMCTGRDARPGDELPPEGQLAERFGVSRAVVREAMRAAEAQGFVRTRQGKPAVISEPNAQPVEDFAIRSVLRDNRSARELTEVRKALEVHSARLAALRVRAWRDEARDGADPITAAIADARSALEAHRDCPYDAPERAAVDVEFHHALAAIGGNAMLGQILTALDSALHDSREEHHHAAVRAGDDPAVFYNQHREVLEAVLSGDPLRAVAAMESHLDR